MLNGDGLGGELARRVESSRRACLAADDDVRRAHHPRLSSFFSRFFFLKSSSLYSCMYTYRDHHLKSHQEERKEWGRLQGMLLRQSARARHLVLNLLAAAVSGHHPERDKYQVIQSPLWDCFL